MALALIQTPSSALAPLLAVCLAAGGFGSLAAEAGASGVAEPSNPPAQPTGLEAFHRSGQTFLTWLDVPDPLVLGYRVYRHDAPIDAGNLHEAALLWELGPDSGAFHADRYLNLTINEWGPRYVARYVTDDLGPELPEGQGFLVWTLAAEDFGGGESGSGYYAVTAVDDLGIENTVDFGTENTFGPVTESIAPPEPVRAKTILDGKAEIYIQYLDLRTINTTKSAPNLSNLWFGLDPDAPEVARSVQYAFTYVLFLPAASGCAPWLGPRPVITVLHGYGGEKLRPYTWDPHPTWCNAYRLYPLDVSNTWWFGNAKDHDYRLGMEIGDEDTIVNYTEQRVLRMLLDLERHPVHGPNVDMNRLFVAGHSMGGSGALAFALRYPNVFAAAHASQPMTDFQLAGSAGGFDWQPIYAVLFGTQAQALPISLGGPEGLADHLAIYEGMNIWEWQNHRQTLETRRYEERAPFGIDHGVADVLMEFATQAEPAYPVLDAASICWAGEIQSGGHIPSNLSTLPGSLAKISGGLPFWGFTGRRNETVPGFRQASGNPPLPPAGTGFFNSGLQWSSSWNPWDGSPLDDAGQWRISLRSMDGSPRLVDVTPRRLQEFTPVPGWAYWASTFDVQTGAQLSSAAVSLDIDGLLTVPNVEARPNGTRVWIRPSLTGTPPQVSVASGGTHTLRMRLGDDLGGSLFLMLGSLSGTTPGLPLGAWHLSLNPDLYFQLLLTAPQGAPLSQNVGFLNASGVALVTFTVPPGLDPSYAGFVFQHAVAVLDPLTLDVQAVTNPTPLALVP